MGVHVHLHTNFSFPASSLFRCFQCYAVRFCQDPTGLHWTLLVCFSETDLSCMGSGTCGYPMGHPHNLDETSQNNVLYNVQRVGRVLRLPFFSRPRVQKIKDKSLLATHLQKSACIFCMQDSALSYCHCLLRGSVLPFFIYHFYTVPNHLCES